MLPLSRERLEVRERGGESNNGSVAIVGSRQSAF